MRGEHIRADRVLYCHATMFGVETCILVSKGLSG